MSLRLITGTANAGKTGAVLKEALAAAAAGASPIVAVPNLVDVRRLEAEISGKSPLGVRVVTLRQLTLELWSLFGDGRRIVDDSTREELLRRVVKDGVEESIAVVAPAPGFRRLLVGLAMGSSAEEGGAPLRGSPTSAIEGLLARYRSELASAGLIEQRWVGGLLAAQAPRIGGPLGVMRFDSLAAHEVEMLAGLSLTNEVTVALTWERMFAPTRANDGAIEYFNGMASSFVELAGPPAHQEIQVLGRRLYSSGSALESRQDVVVGLASGGEAEVAMIARIVADELGSGVRAERIVVAFPHTHRRIVALRTALRSRGISAEFDVTVPFQSTSFGRAWRALVSLAGGGGSRTEALTFIASPYSGAHSEAVHQLDREWRQGRTGDSRVLFNGVARLGGECEFAARLARRVATQPLSADTLLMWQELSDAMLAAAASKTVGMAPGITHSEDSAAHQALNRVLAQLARGSVEPPGLEDVLTLAATIQVSQPTSEAPGNVQVCDFSRVGSRRFDVVVLGGLTEDELPLGTKDSMEELLQRETVRRLEGEAGDRVRLQFYSLLSRARRKLYLVRQEADSEGRELRASELWEDVLDAYRPSDVPAGDEEGAPLPCLRLARADIEELAPALTVSRRQERSRADRMRLSVPIRNAVVSAEGLSALANESVSSATEIEAYLACPYRWFYERIVRPEEIDEALGARELGTHAHGLLAAFYRRLRAESGHQRVAPEWLGEALNLFDEVAAQAGRATTAQSLSEEMRLARAVAWARNVVGQDAALLPGFVPELFEFGFGDEPPFTFAGFPFRGRIDRIDAGSEGVFVTDYKSSREVTGLQKLGADGKVQAVIYACAAQHALGRPVCGSVYRSMSSGHLRGFWRHDLLGVLPVGMCEDDALDEGGFDAVVDSTEERVAEAIRGMRAGRIPRTPAVKGACTHCSLSVICEGARA
ncbi:MAG: PD-(D/E)XK nuclease family protein [Coriobacteriia bacterium]|nr:PD-(D/E)XK nuclease family protein [Coriobacteriia bacterium]